MGIRYLGPTPSTDGSILTKKWVDDTYATIRVDNAYVDSRTAMQIPTLITQAEVDALDNLRAKKADVTAADANYIHNSQKGVAGGIATINSSGYIPNTQIPATVSDRVPFAVPGSVTLTGIKEVLTTSPKEFQAGTLTIPDPGYPYQVFAFAEFRGASTESDPPLDPPIAGVASYGKVTILGPSDRIYAQGVSSGNYRFDSVRALPYAALNETSFVRNGTTTLDLWLSLWSGETYTYTGEGSSWYALVMPAITTGS